MEKTTKALLLACFILGGPWHSPLEWSSTSRRRPPNPIQTNKTSIVNNNAGVNKRAKEWNVSYCPYCGVPINHVEEIPYLIDANGIMHGHIYKVYGRGHRSYMGEDLGILQYGTRRLGILSKLCKRNGGEVDEIIEEEKEIISPVKKLISMLMIHTKRW